MSTPQKVQVFSLGVPAKGTPTAQRRYRVKWRIDGRDRTRSLKTRAEAERFRRLLLDAVAAGVPFDAATGEPASWSSESPTWFAWSQQWLELKWRQWAGTTRRSGVETLVSITPLMVPRVRRRPLPASSSGCGPTATCPDRRSGTTIPRGSVAGRCHWTRSPPPMSNGCSRRSLPARTDDRSRPPSPDDARHPRRRPARRSTLF